MAYRIVLRRDTSTNWTTNNPVLLLGEPGFETDTSRMKIGDGSTLWEDLPYYVGYDLLALDSDLIPATGGAYDLGATAGYSWRDLYLSGNTIYLGDATLSAVGSSVSMDTIILGGPTADGGVIISATGGYLTSDGSSIMGPTGATGPTGGVELSDRLISTNPYETLEAVLDVFGTLNVPLLLPTSFTAVCDGDHMIDPVGFADDDWWQFQVAFQVNPDGTVQTMIDNIFPILTNPGYVSGYTFRFTEVDHGIPDFDFDIQLNDVVLPGGAGWTANIAVTPPPNYPSTIESQGAIKLTSDTKSLIFGTDGKLTLPTEGSIQFPDGSIQTTAFDGEILPVQITYSELYSGVTGGSLIPGSYYSITDFKNCYDQPDYDFFGNAIVTGNYKEDADVSPIIVFATSENTLSPDAYQPQYPKDKIKYDITFNVTEVTGNPALGRITERIDEWGNRTDYDHRSILFRRYSNYYYQENNIAQGTIEVIGGTGGTGGVIGTETNFTSYTVGTYIAIPNSSEIFFEISSIESDTSMTVSGLSIPSIPSGSSFYIAQRDGLIYKQNNISIEYTEHPTFLFDEETIIGNYLGDVASFIDWGGNTFLLPNNVFGEDVIGNRIGNEFINNTFNSDVEHNIIEDQFENNTVYNNQDFTDNQISANFRDNLIICDDFNDNIIGDNFNNNKIFNNSNFVDNLIGIGFDYNTIYSDFGDNKIGTGFSDNTIDTSSFRDNSIGNYFYDNVIDGDFYDNIIGNDFAQNTLEDTFEKNQISNLFKGNLILGYFSSNKIGNMFKANEIENSFSSNNIGNFFFSNDIGTDFMGNFIMDEFSFNQILNNFRYNKIGNYFQSNNIDNDFGFGGGSYRGNIIGNNFYNNNIGEYFYDNNISDNFYDNTIGDYFQFNRVETPLNSIDFTQNLGRINGYESTPGLAGTDGIYYNITGTTNGEGINAEFTIGISSGIINSVELTNPGQKYINGDLITIDTTPFGGTEPLVITVTLISAPPMVYGYYNKTIQRDFDGTPLLVAIANGSLYISQYITEPID